MTTLAGVGSRVRLRHLTVALAVAAACGRDGSAARTGASVGNAAPVFSAVDLDGKPVHLDSLKGKVVVLNEWATWCEPCRDEIPQLEALHQRFASQGLVLVGVSVDAFGTGGDVRDFVQQHGMTYPVWLDPDNRFAARFGTFGVPETFVIDRGGVVRRRQIGALRTGDTTLAAAIQQALGQDKSL